MDPNKRTISVDLRIIIGLLLAVIIAMLLLWRPWSGSGVTDRTVEVTGDAKITAVPDEFVFYPSYQFKNSDKNAALKELTAKSDEVTRRLKELGVADNKIKTDSNGYDNLYYMERDTDTSTYTLQLTVTVGNKDMAQKVQDYLASTTPTGTVSPQASFSDAKRKELETQARDKATKDARGKAEQMGKNLGFKLGKVKTINDGGGFGIIRPFEGATALSATDAKESAPRLQVQPGENDLPYSVTVTYYIR